MWLSRQMRQALPEQQSPEETTLQTARTRLISADNERLQLLSPGGYAWRPCVGERLLVLKDLILGSRRGGPVELSPGECCLYTDGASIHLTADGRIVLRGSVVYADNEEE